MSTVDPALVERIEVVRGAGSVLYGTDALPESDGAERGKGYNPTRGAKVVAFADPTRYGIAERRNGQDHSQHAADVLHASQAPEVDGALLLATVSDDRPGLVEAASQLRQDRA